jgi:hypothetical protein
MAAVPIKIVNAKISGGGQLIEDATITGSIGLADVGVGGGPIEPPITEQPPPDPSKSWEAKTFWSANTGWMVVLVPADDTLVPTPSKRR